VLRLGLGWFGVLPMVVGVPAAFPGPPGAVPAAVCKGCAGMPLMGGHDTGDPPVGGRNTGGCACRADWQPQLGSFGLHGAGVAVGGTAVWGLDAQATKNVCSATNQGKVRKTDSI